MAKQRKESVTHQKKQVKKRTSVDKTSREAFRITGNCEAVRNSKRVCKQQEKTTVRGRFVKGQSGNPNGRPKGSTNKYSINEFMQAIHNVEDKKSRGKKRRITFLEKWVESAWGKPDAMAKVANFIMPTLKSIEQVTYDTTSMEKQEAEEIRKRLQERFGHTRMLTQKND